MEILRGKKNPAFLSQCPGTMLSSSRVTLCISNKYPGSISSQNQFRCPCQATRGTKTSLTVVFLKVPSPSTFSIICKALQSEKWSQTTWQVPHGETLNMGRSWEVAGNSGLLRCCEQEGRRHEWNFSRRLWWWPTDLFRSVLDSVLVDKLRLWFSNESSGKFWR